MGCKVIGQAIGGVDKLSIVLSDFFAKGSRIKPALPLMVSIEIAGIGFPLACATVGVVTNSSKDKK